MVKESWSLEEMADSRTMAGNIVDELGGSCRNYKEVLLLKQTMIGVLTNRVGRKIQISLAELQIIYINTAPSKEVDHNSPFLTCLDCT